jgi:hypothetical protein
MLSWRDATCKSSAFLASVFLTLTLTVKSFRASAILSAATVALLIVALFCAPRLTKGMKSVGSLVIIIGGLVYGQYAYRSVKSKFLELREAPLLPDHQPIQVKGCPGPPHALKVLMGHSAFNVTHFPFRAIYVSNKPLMLLERDVHTAGILISLKIFDDDGHIMVRAEHNNFWIRLDVRMERPSPSRLMVYDNHDEKALDVDFINVNTMRIDGIFRDEANPKSPKPLRDIDILLDRNCFDDVGLVVGRSVILNGG